MELEGRKLVVIGGAGFIGSHTVDRLLEENPASILIYDNFSRGTRENLAAALRDPRVRLFEAGGDILRTDLLEEALQNADGVFHFAALWLLHCQDYPRSAFDVNVAGTFNVLEACVRAGVKRLVYSSSASVYGDAEQEPMTEEHPFRNKTFYGATKIAGEAMLTAYHHRFALGCAGLRYMNVYGPRQDYSGAYIAVMMRMLDAIDRGEDPVIHGDGSEAFDFVAVEDCARANVLAMRAETQARFYNVGTGLRTTLRELVALLLELTGSSLEARYVPRPDSGLVRTRVGCTRRAREEIGFEAVTGLREGLRQLIAWRAAHRARTEESRP